MKTAKQSNFRWHPARQSLWMKNSKTKTATMRQNYSGTSLAIFCWGLWSRNLRSCLLSFPAVISQSFWNSGQREFAWRTRESDRTTWFSQPMSVSSTRARLKLRKASWIWYAFESSLENCIILTTKLRNTMISRSTMRFISSSESTKHRFRNPSGRLKLRPKKLARSNSLYSTVCQRCWGGTWFITQPRQGTEKIRP